MSSQSKQVITHEVSISQEFYAEMARVVGSVGEYLVFDGQDEAINYLKGNDCLIFSEEEEIYDFITDSDSRVEWCKDVLRTHDNCRIIDEGDDCLVFEDLDEARQAVAEESDVGDVFSQEAIESWVAENSSIQDVFDEDAIVEWCKENISIDEMFEWFEDDAIKASVSFKKRFGETGVLFTVEEDKARQQVKKLTTENEELKAKIAKMERTVSTAKQIRHLITDLVMPAPNHQERDPRDDKKRPGFDGFVWTWNADAGRGEWC